MELAERVSGWTGKEIPYAAISDKEYLETFDDPHWGKVIVSLYKAARRGLLSEVTDDYGKIVGRDALTVSEVYREYFDGRR